MEWLAVVGLLAVALAIWTWSQKRRRSAAGRAGGREARIRETKSYQREVVGESFHQDALKAICGPYNPDGRELETRAVLTPDDDNPHDPNAVRVEIQGRMVGHLPRPDAARFRADANAAGLSGVSVQVGAEIRGGWVDGKTVGQYGVRLNYSWPIRPA